MSIIVFILNNIKVSSVYFKTKINCFVFHPLCRSSSSRISKLVPSLSRDFFRSSCCNFFKQFQASKLSSRFSLGISAEVSPEIFLNGSRGISPEVSLVGVCPGTLRKPLGKPLASFQRYSRDVLQSFSGFILDFLFIWRFFASWFSEVFFLEFLQRLLLVFIMQFFWWIPFEGLSRLLPLELFSESVPEIVLEFWMFQNTLRQGFFSNSFCTWIWNFVEKKLEKTSWKFHCKS